MNTAFLIFLPRDGLLEAFEHVGLVLQPDNDDSADRRSGSFEQREPMPQSRGQEKHRDQEGM